MTKAIIADLIEETLEEYVDPVSDAFYGRAEFKISIFEWDPDMKEVTGLPEQSVWVDLRGVKIEDDRDELMASLDILDLEDVSVVVFPWGEIENSTRGDQTMIASYLLHSMGIQIDTKFQ